MNNTTHPKSEADAKRIAKELCEFLNKNLCVGWQPRVSENLGWHFQVQLGTISVHENIHTGKYWVLISDEIGNANSGAGIWSSGHIESANPVMAIKKAVKVSEDVVYKLVSVIESNDKLLKTKHVKPNYKSLRSLKKALSKNLKEYLTNQTSLRLRGNGVETAQDLINCSEKQLLKFRGLGETSLKEIKEFLSKNKLKLVE